MNPNIHFYCMTCGSTGERTLSYRSSKHVGGFEDVCPTCNGQDVEVLDIRYAKPGQFSAEVPAGGDVT